MSENEIDPKKPNPGIESRVKMDRDPGIPGFGIPGLGPLLRGYGDGLDSNFIQLLRMRASDFIGILQWLDRKTNNYVSPAILNECLKIICLQFLRQVSSCIRNNRFYNIMADECTDSSNQEQFTLCIRWVDESLTNHEDFIGLYHVASIDANTIVATIKDVLLRLGLTLSD